MPPRRVPKNVKVWNEDLIRAAQYRYYKAAREHKRDERHWRQAAELLEACKAPIYKQKTGENAGILLNIPKKINHKVLQVLSSVVAGETPVDDQPILPSAPSRQGQAPKSTLRSDTVVPIGEEFNVTVEMTRFYQNRKYGDSCTALLAGMYASLRPDPDWVMSKDHIIRSGSRFTDLRMAGNWRAGEHGAWKGIQDLERENLVKRRKTGFMSKHEFSLTKDGLKFCHSLFTKKIHPNITPGIPLIEPGYAEVDSDGNVFPKGSLKSSSHFIPENDPSNHGLLALQLRQHERQWLGLNGYENPLDSNDDITPDFNNVLETVEVMLPDDDMLRALRCSKLEKYSTPQITHCQDSDIEEAQLRDVLEMSKKDSSCHAKVHDELRYDEDIQLKRVLEFSKRDTGKVINLDDSQDSHGELEVALSMSMMDDCVGESSQISSVEHQQYEKALRNSLIDDNTSECYNYVHQDSEDEEEDGVLAQLHGEEKRQYLEAIRMSKLVAESNSANQLNARHSPCSSRRKRHRDSPEMLSNNCESNYLRDVYSHNSTTSSSLHKRTKLITPERSGFVSNVKNSFLSNEEHTILPCVDLTGSRNADSISRSKTEKMRVSRHIEVPVYDLTDDVSRVDVVPLNSSERECSFSTNTKKSESLSNHHKTQEFSLMVDTFERVNQKTFRQFFEKINDCMRKFLSECSADQCKLSHGDFHSTVRIDDCDYSLGYIVERKAIGDIVSRSNDTHNTASLAAPHFKQAIALQNSGLESAFLLIEGDIYSAPNVHQAKVDYVGQVSADMISSARDLICFMAQTLAREWTSRKIGILQTWQAPSTAMLLVCMQFLARKRYQVLKERCVSSQSSELLHNKFPPLSSIGKSMVTAKTIKNLYFDLKEAGVHVEMCARVARRFGSWKNLCDAYRECSNEVNARMLLVDLSTSSSKHSVIEGVRLCHEELRENTLTNVEVFDLSCSILQSQRVYEIVLKKFAGLFPIDSSSQLSSYKFDLVKKSCVEVCADLAKIYENESSALLPAGMEITNCVDDADSCDAPSAPTKRLPWLCIKTMSTCYPTGSTRCGNIQRIIVVPGVVMLEALVKARDTLGPPPFQNCDRNSCRDDDVSAPNDAMLPYCYEIINLVFQTMLSPAFPNDWRIDLYDDVGGGAMSYAGPKYQIVLEDFSSPVSTHAASGRLAKVLLKVDNNEILTTLSQQPHSRRAQVVEIVNGGEKLPLNACRDVSTIFLKLLPMLILFLNTECVNCTVIQTKNRKETTMWLEIFCKAVHEESLFFD